MKIQFIYETFDDKSLYYHGTSLENINKIMSQKILYAEYGNGENGIYITDNYLNALDHGEFVFAIDKQFINKTRFFIDDVNDGILYLGGIEINDNISLMLNYNDKRLAKSIAISLLNKIKDEELQN